MAAWVGGEFGGEWIRVCVAESLRCPPETITALLIGCTPIQNKELKKKYNRLDGFTTEVDVSQPLRLGISRSGYPPFFFFKLGN